MAFWTTLAATILGGAAVNEIARKRAPKQKGLIGSGTAPQLDAGIPLELQSIQGTSVNKPEDSMSFDNLSTDEQEKLMMQMLAENNEGVMGMYTGGEVPKYTLGGTVGAALGEASGGGLFGYGLMDNLNKFFDDLPQEAQDVLSGSLSSGIMELLRKREEPKGSQVSTKTLPAGNANRRRFQFEPIGMESGGGVGGAGRALSDKDAALLAALAAQENSQTGRVLSQNDEALMAGRENPQTGRTISRLDELGDLVRKDTEMWKEYSQNTPTFSEYMEIITRGGRPLSPEIAQMLYEMGIESGKLGSPTNPSIEQSMKRGRPLLPAKRNGGVLNRDLFSPMMGGGELDGPGGPKDDLIPIMASDGEFMLSKATVDMLGKGNHGQGIAALEKINNKGNRMYG